MRIDLETQVAADLLGGLEPFLAADAGQQRESAVAGEVDGGDLLLLGHGLVQPRVGQSVAGIRADPVVEDGVFGPLGFRPARLDLVVEEDGGRVVLVVHLDADPVELVAGAFDGRVDPLPPLAGFGRGRLQAVQDLHPLLGGLLHQSHLLPDRHVIADALVRAGHDTQAHGLSLDAEALQERGGGQTLLDVLDLPRQVEGVLDTSVGAQAVERWMPVDGVSQAEDVAVRVIFGHDLVDVPFRNVEDFNGDVVPADDLLASLEILFVRGFFELDPGLGEQDKHPPGRSVSMCRTSVDESRRGHTRSTV